jgi:hypothetical protein
MFKRTREDLPVKVHCQQFYALMDWFVACHACLLVWVLAMPDYPTKWGFGGFFYSLKVSLDGRGGE